MSKRERRILVAICLLILLLQVLGLFGIETPFQVDVPPLRCCR